MTSSTRANSTAANSWLVQLAARLLEPIDREAVLGDLAESGVGAGNASREIFGLAVRRQAGLWKNWRPWLAAFGLAFPGSLLLMGFSLSVTQSYERVLSTLTPQVTGWPIPPGLLFLICNVLLLAAWSWTGGFVVGSISRRTLWVSAALSFMPCVFCLERFRIESLSRFCLLLFLPPAIWGVFHGLRIARIRLSAAIILALAVTALTIPAWGSHGPWIPNWALSWPAWYLVATSWRSRREPVLAG
jgi:hypothetical protein